MGGILHKIVFPKAMGSCTPQHMEGRERRDQEFKAIVNYPMQGQPGLHETLSKNITNNNNVVQRCCCQVSVSVSQVRET